MENIFALSSGVGKAGVAVIRISGAEALKALSFFGIENSNIKPRTARLLNIYDGEALIDNALFIYFKNPASFTGEDVLEIQTHGSKAVVQFVLNKLSQIPNFRMARAGEFSKRAFENGKMDLLQAEGLTDLIEAETLAQARQAARQLEGKNSEIFNNWREKIIEIMAFTEAYVDFPDEDIPKDLDIQAQDKIKSVITEIENNLNSKSGEKLRGGVNVIILGKPNAGKSSLLNWLAKRDVAIVSDIAGTTRDLLECNLEICGVPVTIIDTAGIRETSNTIEKEGIKRALNKAENADLKIIIFDASDEILLEGFGEINADNSLILINKSDLKKINLPEDIQKLNPIFISVKTEENLNVFLEILEKKVESLINLNENPVITRHRHREKLSNCNLYLNEFIAARTKNKPIELCAESLRSAANQLGEITGKIGVEDILDKIFSEFCIGK